MSAPRPNQQGNKKTGAKSGQPKSGTKHSGNKPTANKPAANKQSSPKGSQAGAPMAMGVAAPAAKGVRAAAPVAVGVESQQSWFRANLTKVLAAVGALLLLGGILAVALHERTPDAPAANEPGAVDPGGERVTSAAVGLPIDGAGALTAAVDAPVIVDIYSDFSCPHCASFEAQNAEAILQLAADPDVSVRLHPVSFLDRSQDGSGFSTRAAALLLEVAATSPQHLWAMNDALLHNQAAGQTMTDDQLLGLAHQIGVPISSDMPTIMAARQPEVADFTMTAVNAGVPHIPYVLINGTPWEGGSLYNAVTAELGR